MAYVMFNPSTVNSDLSSTKSRMNFQKFINDYNNGLIDRGGTAKISSLSILVHDVKRDQTVNATVSVYNQIINRSFTSRYEDTISRNIYQDLSIAINPTSFINYLNSNGGNLDATITSGIANYNTPVVIGTEFRTKEIAGVKSGQVTITGSEVDKAIRVTRTDNVNGIYVELDSYNGKEYVELFKGASNGTFVDIPAGTITDLSLEYYVWVYAGLLLESNGPTKLNEGSDSAFLKFKLDNLTVSYPTIDNLATIGEYWERPITVNWRSTHQEGYEWEAYYNNQKVSSGNGGNASSFSIPANTFGGTLPASVRVRVYRTYAGVKYYSGWQEVSFSLKDIEATITNLLVEGEYWENPIKVSWQSTNQQQFKIEVLKSNQVVKTYTGTTSTSYTIEAEQLAEGTYTIKVTVAYANRYVNSSERTVTLKNIEAVVNDISLSGSNVDLELIFSWNSANQQKYEVEIYKNDDRVKNYSGNTTTSVIISPSSLTTGLHRFRVRVAFKDRWTEWKEITATLTETLPSIGALEPDGVITERDNPTRVWWTSQNQSKWKLVIDGITTYTGTTEKEKILLAGVLQTGKHSMELTVTYRTRAGVEKHITKKAEWIVQGKPPIPTITSGSMFKTNRPIILWDTQDQQGYILDILREGVVIYSTDWQNGLVSEHKVMEYLPNGTYTARIKIMNQFSLESDYGSKEFSVNTSIATSINLNAIPVKNSVQLSWSSNGIFQKFYVIRNNEVIAMTDTTSYTDYTAYKECIYTIKGVTDSDVYKDSNEVYVECRITTGIMATIDALYDTIQVGVSREEFKFKGNIDLASTQLVLNGRELPVLVFGEHSNNTYNLKFTSKELFKFLEMCKRRQIFLYRDKRQKLYLSITNPSYTIDMLGIEYTIQAIEVDYNEVITYD